MPIIRDDIVVRQPQWRATVEAAIARGSVRGLPPPADLPPNGDLNVKKDFLRWRVMYRVKGVKTFTLGSASDAGREELQRKLLSQPRRMTLENGRQVIVICDQPGLFYPIPAEVYAQLGGAT